MTNTTSQIAPAFSRFTTFLACIILLFGVAACSDDDGTTTPNNNQDPEPQSGPFEILATIPAQLCAGETAKITTQFLPQDQANLRVTVDGRAAPIVEVDGNTIEIIVPFWVQSANLLVIVSETEKDDFVAQLNSGCSIQPEHQLEFSGYTPSDLCRGDEIRISGKNFLAYPGMRIRVGGQEAEIISLTDSEVHILQPGAIGTGTLTFHRADGLLIFDPPVGLRQGKNCLANAFFELRNFEITYRRESTGKDTDTSIVSFIPEISFDPDAPGQRGKISTESYNDGLTHVIRRGDSEGYYNRVPPHDFDRASHTWYEQITVELDKPRGQPIWIEYHKFSDGSSENSANNSLEIAKEHLKISLSFEAANESTISGSMICNEINVEYSETDYDRKGGVNVTHHYVSHSCADASELRWRYFLP